MRWGETAALPKLILNELRMNIGISPRLLPSIATIYIDVNRVFLEFIDNSLDEAEQFYDPASDSYSKEIKIEIIMTGLSHKEFKIEIKDNCTGIADLKTVFTKIGNSGKKNIPQVNGKFGFGMYSFISLCCLLTIMSCNDGNEIKTVQISRDMFEKDSIEETDIEISTESSHFTLANNARLFEIGTSVTLQNFDKGKYKQINPALLVNEVEKHFEILLKRKNLEITVSAPNGQIFTCKPFNYDNYDGAIYYKRLEKLDYIAVKKTGVKKTMDISGSPVIIFIKITNNKTIDRNPFFVIQGRRITEISDVKAFRTNSKSLIWSHPNITGYIDVTGTLEPTIARNEFKNSDHQRALFYTLLQEEASIKDFINNELKINLRSKFKRLELILENTLNQVASEFSELNKRHRKSKKEIKSKFQNSYMSYTVEDRSVKEPLSFGGINSGSEFLTCRKKRFKKVKLPVYNNLSSSIDNVPENGRGFNIKIDCETEPLKDNYGNKLKSVLNGTEIIIYQKHPEFQSRLDNTRDGMPKLTVQLINYLCTEILVHYKAQEHLKTGEELKTKEMLLEFSNSLYSFERKLYCLEGKKLSEFH